MKRRLNILCIAVFLVLGFSLYTSGYQFGRGIKIGLELGEEQGKKLEESKKELLPGDYRLAELVPIEAMWEPDTLVNAKTGRQTPVVYKQMLVQIDPQMKVGHLVLQMVCSLLYIVVTLVALILFVMLVASINKSQIFEWRNVKRLRWLGVLLIITFVCSILPKLVSQWGIGDVFGMERYIVAPISFQVTDLLLGLGCLIVAETFAIGLKMKEEQELTI